MKPVICSGICCVAHSAMLQLQLKNTVNTQQDDLTSADAGSADPVPSGATQRRNVA
jgi:hypothetical protein